MRLEDLVAEKVEEHGCEGERESYNGMGVPLTSPG
jgi:hypothetical protein